MKKWLFAIVFTFLMVSPTNAQEVPTGEIITVEGVADIVTENAFALLGPSLDVAPGRIVVFPPTAEGFAIDINNGLEVEVTGEIVQFDFAFLQEALDYDLNLAALGGFGTNDYAMIATTVTSLTETIILEEPDVIDLETDPTLFTGEIVTVEGFVDIVSPNVFRLLNTEPFDLSPANMLVMPDTPAGFAIDINNGMRVQVTGTLQAFDREDIELTLGYDLDDVALAPYDITDYAVIATSVVDLTERVIYDDPTIIDIETDPTLYFDQTISVRGTADIASSRAFEIINITPFDFTPSRVVVVPDTPEGFSIDINNGIEVIATGTLVSFDLFELEARLGYDLNNIALADYGPGDYAVIASSVVQVE